MPGTPCSPARSSRQWRHAPRPQECHKKTVAAGRPINYNTVIGMQFSGGGAAGKLPASLALKACFYGKKNGRQDSLQPKKQNGPTPYPRPSSPPQAAQEQGRKSASNNGHFRIALPPGLSFRRAQNNPAFQYQLPPEAAIAVLKAGGYRISEVLSLRFADVLPGDRVLVRAAKRGSASLCTIPGISLLTVSLPPDLRQFPIFGCGYTAVYRAMLRRGYAVQPEGHQNRSVTHTPRRQLAQQVAAMATPLVAGQVLNHTSTTAINYYLEKGIPKYTIDIEAEEYGFMQFYIDVNPLNWSILTTAWEFRIISAGETFYSTGKGYIKGFVKPYPLQNAEPQYMETDPMRPEEPRSVLLTAAFPNGTTSTGYAF